MAEKVSEETAREALGNAIKGFTTQQAELGVLPSSAKAEAFVRPIVDETIKRHESGINRTEDPSAGVAPGEPKARLDRGEVGDGRVLVSRPIDWSSRSVGARPRGKDDKLLRERLALLEGFPEWRAKLIAAGIQGEQEAINSGSVLDRVDMTRRAEFITRSMMRVIEQSNNVFGDYLRPKRKAKPIVVAGR